MTAAMHEFARAGYRDAKTDVIAKEAGVSKGLVFHYFQSKANLYVAAVRWTLQRINAIADWTVWQKAPDLPTMVRRAMRYKLKLQVEYPDEFALSLAAYSDGSQLPEALRPKLQALWQDEIQGAVPQLTGPVFGRMHLREGVAATTVQSLVVMMSDLISTKAKAFMHQHPDATVADLEFLVDDTLAILDVMEHGFLAPEGSTGNTAGSGAAASGPNAPGVAASDPAAASGPGQPVPGGVGPQKANEPPATKRPANDN
nr:TetR family transcriptional regulator [Lacticaseibacillus parakribbianus]